MGGCAVLAEWRMRDRVQSFDRNRLVACDALTIPPLGDPVQSGIDRPQLLLRLDPVGHRVLADDRELKVGPTEFRLLQFLMGHPERVYSRGQLIDQVWGRNVYIEERTVDVHVRRLREALAPGGKDRLVQTVRGAGYRLSAKD